MAQLNGMAALVTGGSRGIGATIARQFALEGADVAFTYTRSADKAQSVVDGIRTTGQRALAMAADSADPDEIKRAVAVAAKTFGRLDILVNSAGIFRVSTLDSVTLEDFNTIIAVNVRGAFLAAQAAATHMKEGSRIISIGSNLAEHTWTPGLSLYALSKAALTGMTKALARDLGSRGITVNIVHPGSTNTDMNPENGPHADQQRERMAIPRFGKPQNIASLVAWLASPDAQFVTGASLTIDGGANA